MADWKAFKDDCQRLLTEDNITDEVTKRCNHVIGAILQAAEKYVLVFKKSKNPTTRRFHTGRMSAQRRSKNPIRRRTRSSKTCDLIGWQAYYKLKASHRVSIEMPRNSTW